MSVIENIDNTIVEWIEELIKEYKTEGLLRSPSDERKTEILGLIAKLRASIAPQCNCKK